MRILAPMLVLLLLAGCAQRTAPPPSTGPAPLDHPRVIEHTVAVGETVRLIADNYYGDPDRVATVLQANGLESGEGLAPGSVLRLPFAPDQWERAQRRADALVSYNEGVDALAAERLADAQRRFETALEIEPELASASYNLALVLLKRGRAERALDLLDELTARRPDDTTFLFARGNALFQATRFSEAADQFAAIVAVDPQAKRAAFGLARSLQEAQRTDEAVAAWERYLELDATSGWARTARENLERLRHGDDRP